MSMKMFVDLGLLRRNRDFRSVFIARTISLLGLGMLSVAVPMQVYALTGDSLQVGLALALEGGGMFAGLLLGGVLADRYDRRKLILLARTRTPDYDGPVTLFIAGQSLPGYIRPLEAWRRHVPDLEVHHLAHCSHENILSPQSLEVLGPLLDRAIGGAEQRLQLRQRRSA